MADAKTTEILKNYNFIQTAGLIAGSSQVFFMLMKEQLQAMNDAITNSRTEKTPIDCNDMLYLCEKMSWLVYQSQQEHDRLCLAMKEDGKSDHIKEFAEI